MSLDKIKEILNTLRIWLTMLYGSLVILIGGLVNEIKNNKFDILFFIGLGLAFILLSTIIFITLKISKLLKQIN